MCGPPEPQHQQVALWMEGQTFLASGVRLLDG
jgi:hypothetical protein